MLKNIGRVSVTGNRYLILRILHRQSAINDSLAPKPTPKPSPNPTTNPNRNP